MRWPDLRGPVAMRRVAVVAPTRRWPAVLAAVGAAGVMEPDPPLDTTAAPAASPEAVGTTPFEPSPTGGGAAHAPPGSEGTGASTVEGVTRAAVTHGDVTALAGWTPASAVGPLTDRLAPLGGAVVEMPVPPAAEVPSLLGARRGGRALRPLVETYATVPYRDVDPTWFATIAYVFMFAMMFGDLGDGLLLVAGALALRRSRSARLDWARPMWPLLCALGLGACAFGFAYGDFFGPTHVIPTLWLSPLDDPEQLLVVAVVIGAVLLAGAYAIGIVNRARESGLMAALWDPAGVAGATLFCGLALLAGGVALAAAPVWISGLAIVVLGLGLAGGGLRAEAGPGASGATQAGVELFDLVLRQASNLVSFARLAAFGLTHAALGAVIWDATTSLWGHGAASLGAVLVFVVGHVVAFALEALVAGVQALRLEYYELFSRIFVGQGRAFHPWRLPDADRED
jgi:V/A-type H+-transporting ATPase subunit I